ncbi:MAG: ABC transporter permease [Thaumarchaeota archaeon]|nr:ABC transporter permease [Nitrososphaerota archaeon]
MRATDVFSLSFEALVDRKVRTVLTILMVVLGSSLVVVINGLSAGQSAFLEKQFNVLAANVIFVSSGLHSYHSESSSASLIINSVIVNRIRQLPFVEDTSPSYSGSIQISSQGNVQHVGVHGMDPTKISEILPNVEYVDGSTIKPNDNAAIIVGDTVANPPGATTPFVSVGQTVQATFTYADPTGKQEQETKSFVVTAIMKPSGNNYLDNSVLINLNAADQLLRKSEKYDSVTVLALSPEYVDTVQQELTGQFGQTLGITTPKAIMAVREQTASGNAMFVLMIGIIALVVGAVGIVTTLYNSVTERVREIGTLKAIGAQNTDVLGLFIVEAVLIGIIGATLGIVIGIGGGYLMSLFSIGSPTGPGPAANIQPIYAPADLLKVWLLSVTLSIMAGVFPAWKASKLSPLVALRRD